jgi:hypothetical protein
MQDSFREHAKHALFTVAFWLPGYYRAGASTVLIEKRGLIVAFSKNNEYVGGKTIVLSARTRSENAFWPSFWDTSKARRAHCGGRIAALA